MKNSRFTDSQIVAVLKEVEAGVPIADAKAAQPPGELRRFSHSLPSRRLLPIPRRHRIRPVRVLLPDAPV